MKKFFSKRIIAFSLWLITSVLTFACSSCHMHSVHMKAEEALSFRATQVAEQLSSFLSVPNGTLDAPLVRSVVFSAMNNKELYAVVVSCGDTLLEGQRRSMNGELESWDGVIAEKTVQATTPISVDDANVGTVSIYLRQEPLLSFIEDIAIHEMFLFTMLFFFSTFCLILYLLSIGDLPHLREYILFLYEKILKKIGKNPSLPSEEKKVEQKASDCINLEAGKVYQETHDSSKLVTPALFRHTFAMAPDVMLRFVADKNAKGLVHLASLIEESAPCIGAFDLQNKAIRLQEAISSSPEEMFCLEVEACIQSLEQVLAALES